MGAIERVVIASPCPVPWESMRGDERVRYCGQCKLKVYNLSGMPRAAAEKILQTHDGRLCAQLYRRADGTVLTQDCPAWTRKVRRRIAMLAYGLVTFIAMILGSASIGSRYSNPLRQVKPIKTVLDWIDPEFPRGWGRTGGVVCVPTPTSPPPPLPPQKQE